MRSLRLVAAFAALLACSPPPIVASTGGGSGGSGGSGGGAAGGAGGGSTGADGGVPLFTELFGSRDATLPGGPCHAQSDRCRGSTRLYVCLNDARMAVASDATCRTCLTTAECTYEYSFYGAQGVDVTCGSDGLCHPNGLGAEQDGAWCDGAGPGYCNTMKAGWYPCDPTIHECVRCTTNSQCMVYGPKFICSGGSLGMPGACVESF